MPPPPNLYDAAATFRALNEHRPGWRWGVVAEEPVNGRFYVDHMRSRLLLPGYLICGEVTQAFIDAGNELLHGNGAGLPDNVEPLYRRRARFMAELYPSTGDGAS